MRRLQALGLAFLLFFSGVSSGSATTQIIMSGNDDDLNATTTEYIGFIGGKDNVWNNNSNRNIQKVSANGNVKNLRVVLTAAPGSGTSHTLTAFIAGSASTLGCTVSDTNTSCQDADSVAVSAGNDIQMRSTHSTTPAVSDAWWSVEFDSTTSNQSLLGAHTSAGFQTTRYVPLYGTSDSEGTRTDVEIALPAGGTLKNLYCDPDNDPGVGNTHVCTVMVDGSDTGLTCTVSSGSTNCSDTSNTASVSAGQVAVLKVVHASSLSIEIDAGVTFESTTAGQHLVGFSSDGAPSTSAANYACLAAGDTGWSATETTCRTLGQIGSASSLVLDALYVNLTAAPGASKSYAFTVYQNGSPTGLTCTVSGTDTSCNNSTNVTIANDDQYSIEVVPSGTPTATVVRMGVLVSPPPSTARRVIMVN